MKILIMGLPGSGKTTLAQQMVWALRRSGKSVIWYNADEIRRIYNDWDFTDEGRLRQAERMRNFAELQTTDFVICDFVAPLPVMRDIFAADYTIWLDTIKESRYRDTDKIFIKPNTVDVQIENFDANSWALKIVQDLLK